MSNLLRARAIAVASLIAIAFIAPAAAAQGMVRHDDIRSWISRYHPNVGSGDRRVNAVLIVVDSNSQYVASAADSLPAEVAAAIDSAFESVGVHNEIEGMARELVAGRLRVPGADGSQPIYIVDGVRVSRVDSLNVNWIENIQFTRGDEASMKYGADAAKGAIVVTMIHSEGRSKVIESSHRQRVSKLGIQPDRIDTGDVMMMHVRAGVFGPYPMYVTVLHLKR